MVGKMTERRVICCIFSIYLALALIAFAWLKNTRPEQFFYVTTSSQAASSVHIINLDKCKVMCFGKLNQSKMYTVNDRALGSAVEQTDLGVQEHGSLKVVTHVDNMVKKTCGMFAFIGQGIEYKSWDIMLQLYKALVSQLCKKKMSVDDDHYFQYKGCNFVASIYKKEYLEQLEDFEIQDSDVFIVTYPKSGTAWMQNILSLIYSDGDVAVVESKQALERVPWIELPGRNLSARPLPRLFATHLPYHLIPKALKEKKGKVIYVARNPKDVLVSSYYFHYYFALYESPKNFQDFFEKFIDGRVEFSCWFDHIKDWCAHKDELNFLFLTYEELKKDLAASVQKICNFVGRQLDAEKLGNVIKNSTFDQMKNNPMANYEEIPSKCSEGAFLRKGIVGDWKNHFTVAQSEMFDKIFQERMKDVALDDFWDKE